MKVKRNDKNKITIVKSEYILYKALMPLIFFGVFYVFFMKTMLSLPKDGEHIFLMVLMTFTYFGVMTYRLYRVYQFYKNIPIILNGNMVKVGAIEIGLGDITNYNVIKKHVNRHYVFDFFLNTATENIQLCSGITQDEVDLLVLELNTLLGNHETEVWDSVI